MDNVRIDPQRIVRHFHRLQKEHDAVIVEGAGGVMVPICWDYSYLDLLRELAIPAVIVARAGLGTINHTLLTNNALRDQGTEVFAIVLNRRSSSPDLAEQTNAAAVRRLTGCDRVWALPEINGSDNGALAQEMKALLRELF